MKSSVTDTPSKDNLIKIGQLKKPYGIKGWLWLWSYLDNREDIFAMGSWWIQTAKGLQPLTVVKWRKQGSGLVAQFAEVADRNIAETMNGVTIWANAQALPQADEDEFYWSDLIGLTVVTEDKICLGNIKEMLETGANDVMVVTPTADSVDNEQRLIPWHKTTVIKVDLSTKQVTVAWEVDY